MNFRRTQKIATGQSYQDTSICPPTTNPILMHNILLLFRARWVKIQGTEYREQCALLIAVEDDYPVFARVEDIYVIDGSRIVFQVCVFRTLTFCRHHHLFIISNTHTCKLVNADDLYHSFPFCIRQVSIDDCTQHAIIPKYHITGTLQ